MLRDPTGLGKKIHSPATGRGGRAEGPLGRGRCLVRVRRGGEASTLTNPCSDTLTTGLGGAKQGSLLLLDFSSLGSSFLTAHLHIPAHAHGRRARGPGAREPRRCTQVASHGVGTPTGQSSVVYYLPGDDPESPLRGRTSPLLGQRLTPSPGEGQKGTGVKPCLEHLQDRQQPSRSPEVSQARSVLRVSPPLIFMTT